MASQLCPKFFAIKQLRESWFHIWRNNLLTLLSSGPTTHTDSPVPTVCESCEGIQTSSCPRPPQRVKRPGQAVPLSRARKEDSALDSAASLYKLSRQHRTKEKTSPPSPSPCDAHHRRVVFLQGSRSDHLAEEPPVPERMLLPLKTLIE